MYAGVYAFICGALLLRLLGPVSDTLATLLALPTDHSALLFAGPAALIGAVVWRAVVERRDGYAYPIGGAFGLLTALFTVIFWVLLFVIVWGPPVLTGGILILFVLVVAVPVGFVCGLTAMYARRRLDDGTSDGTERAP